VLARHLDGAGPHGQATVPRLLIPEAGPVALHVVDELVQCLTDSALPRLHPLEGAEDITDAVPLKPSQSPFPRPCPQGAPEALPYPILRRPVQHQRKSRCAVLRLSPGRSDGAAARPGARRKSRGRRQVALEGSGGWAPEVPAQNAV
jgi:hypothetical protein